jgi:hypothetical protein
VPGYGLFIGGALILYGVYLTLTERVELGGLGVYNGKR